MLHMPQDSIPKHKWTINRRKSTRKEASYDGSSETNDRRERGGEGGREREGGRRGMGAVTYSWGAWGCHRGRPGARHTNPRVWRPVPSRRRADARGSHRARACRGLGFWLPFLGVALERRELGDWSGFGRKEGEERRTELWRETRGAECGRGVVIVTTVAAWHSARHHAGVAVWIFSLI